MVWWPKWSKADRGYEAVAQVVSSGRGPYNLVLQQRHLTSRCSGAAPATLQWEMGGETAAGGTGQPPERGGPLNLLPLGGAHLFLTQEQAPEPGDKQTTEDGNDQEVTQNRDSDGEDEHRADHEQQSWYRGTHWDAIYANPRVSVHA